MAFLLDVLFMIEENKALIAPCGINCGVCTAYLALAKEIPKQKGVSYCTGCHVRNKNCAFIKKHCTAGLGKTISFCFEDPSFPCEKLTALDDRYRRDYHVSPIENLKTIRDRGMDAFIELQEQEFTCSKCGGTIGVHNRFCYDCEKDQLQAYVDRKKTSIKKQASR
jgi:hypothetical protein